MNNNYQFNKKFNSLDNNHQVEITIIDNIAWFNINKVEYQNYKTFLLLLRDVINFLSKNNVEYIKQKNISQSDLEFLKLSTFVQIDDNEYTISTSITDFINEIINILDIKIY